MKLSDLIAAYGDEVVQFQNLDRCTIYLDITKSGTNITFGTEQPFTPDGTEKLGIVVWMDRDRVKAIIDAAKGPTS
jgi:hypothetical protein